MILSVGPFEVPHVTKEVLGCITALRIPAASQLPAEASGWEKDHNVPSILLKSIQKESCERKKT